MYMSTEDTSIHDFDYALICDYFSTLDRQGPGSPEVTAKALECIDNLTSESRIADIGCGTGGQTLVLAEHAPGRITALDLFPEFIAILEDRVRNAGLQDRIKGVVGSMEALSFQDGELDLIWSEGAIYNIGFERGINEWHRFLKKGGFLAVSEACWFTEERPEEIERFWNDAYPEMGTISSKVSQMEQAGYVPVATFILPETCWTTNYYLPQKAAQEDFLRTHAGNPMAEELVKNERHEAALYATYKKYYGYAFFIGRKL
jgi:ubiquinone/menaquinone biosynthesis C-methylase UbiE